MTRRHSLLLVAALLGGAACDDTGWRWDPERPPCAVSHDDNAWMCGPDAPAWEGCAATLCLAGFGWDQSDGNDYLEELCPMLPGLVEYCPAGEDCRAVFYDVDAAWRALLDLTERASRRESPCSVSLVAHSWGAFDAVDLAARLAAHQGAPRASLDRLVTLDPYRALPPDALDVPASVTATRNYFRPAIHDDDCSEAWGGFDGRPIRCESDADCRQLDLTRNGYDPGHCNMIHAAWWRVLPFVVDGEDIPASGLEVDVERR